MDWSDFSLSLTQQYLTLTQQYFNSDTTIKTRISTSAAGGGTGPRTQSALFPLDQTRPRRGAAAPPALPGRHPRTQSHPGPAGIPALSPIPGWWWRCFLPSPIPAPHPTQSPAGGVGVSSPGLFLLTPLTYSLPLPSSLTQFTLPLNKTPTRNTYIQ